MGLNITWQVGDSRMDDIVLFVSLLSKGVIYWNHTCSWNIIDNWIKYIWHVELTFL